MIFAHGHPGPILDSPGLPEAATAGAALLAIILYLSGAGRLRHRADRWPWRRDASFIAGSAGVAWVAVGSMPGGPFTAHMLQHLMVGMAAPLLLVLGRPLTLALRSMTPGTARRLLLALAHSLSDGWLVFPPLMALLDIGSLWLLYGTGLFAAIQDEPRLHVLLHIHVLAVGLLFTFAVCQLDPVRRRWGLGVRAMTLLAVGTAHTVLAKTLYAAAPPDTAFAVEDLHIGAQAMYYGGDLIEAALATVLATSWLQATSRAHRRRLRSEVRRERQPTVTDTTVHKPHSAIDHSR
ncbi:cytochrome c oxidase assembly protein [Actinacidiphila glaucinigra]|uniref:cytochrome c oxidase assembly protein n=1 Tax=Actinacidiphila glaucinigra TaxID=235986 RepID=UPI0036C19C10